MTEPRRAIRIEVETGRAWCGERLLDLTPKVFAILRHFVENPERLVTKDDLFQAVWSDAVVSDAALTSCIRDLRRELGDTSRRPQYVETVHRRGFRFIGPIASGRPFSAAPPPLRDRAPAMVGRDAELARLAELFATATSGRRRVVFVTGEPGIGKTTLVDAFVSSLDGDDRVRIGRGQCVDHYGAGEAYLPILEALARLARASRGDGLLSAFTRHAPSWLAELPGLLSDDDLATVHRRAQGATRERMLRELSEALDVVANEAPLLLVLEDVHWADSATVDLLAMLARRREPARILIVATYRPADVAATEHPLKAVKRELQLHGDCDELALDFLSEPLIAAYLAERFARAPFTEPLARLVHRNTSGNPLFMVSAVDDLVARGRLREVDGRWMAAQDIDEIGAGVPETLAQLVDHQIDRLAPEEQAVLAVASVAGAEFSAALVSVDGTDPVAAEACCATLARRGQFLRTAGAVEWPDGTVAGRYAFIHALHRTVLYDRVSIGRRVQLHLRIGARLETAYGRHVPEIAGELAMHFEHGRDVTRAIRFRVDAAENALRHHAHHEAADHTTRALALLRTLPDVPERRERELALLTIHGAALVAKGWAAPEVARTYARARELCQRIGITAQRFPVVGGLFGYFVTRADLDAARELADQLAVLAASSADSRIQLGAHNAAGMVRFYGGDPAAALEALEHGIGVYDPQQHNPNRAPAFWGGHDTGVSCAVHAAWCLWLLGRWQRATAMMADALTWARDADHPFTLAYACHFAASFHECRRDPEAARAVAEEAERHSTEFALLASVGAIHRGWLDGDVALIAAGVDAYRATGSRFGLPTYLGLLAEAHERTGEAETGLAIVADARRVADDTGAHYWDAELARLHGALLLARGGARPRGRATAAANAEAAFRDALAIATAQGARALALRAATSLARLWQERGQHADAHTLLAGACLGFDADATAPDLRDARALLAATAGHTTGAR